LGVAVVGVVGVVDGSALGAIGLMVVGGGGFSKTHCAK
jgi:hypothetical protein